jgi:hypothetical protein
MAEISYLHTCTTISLRYPLLCKKALGASEPPILFDGDLTIGEYTGREGGFCKVSRGGEKGSK